MTLNKTLLAAFCCVLLHSPAHAQAEDTNHAVSANSDNTEVNTRDRNESEQTADEADNSTSDLEVMQKIRQAVMADDTLSVYGQNVKIISENGKVTLKGPVENEAERKSIEHKATEVVGAENVTNQLSVDSD